ncbi:hypothetical protein GOP47_0017151 [Adiantum capillus-veneris]|uniref:Uncharacterized protein n=1 Tax=Adiantum capillus-veneris TaxID=13818 RepID=A0A9D4UJZ6_ADICA|nr:hypothetical protein GOP47_0017151 [Adiantum capillus-veneris]
MMACGQGTSWSGGSDYDGVWGSGFCLFLSVGLGGYLLPREENSLTLPLLERTRRSQGQSLVVDGGRSGAFYNVLVWLSYPLLVSELVMLGCEFARKSGYGLAFD